MVPGVPSCPQAARSFQTPMPALLGAATPRGARRGADGPGEPRGAGPGAWSSRGFALDPGDFKERVGLHICI